MKLSWDEAVEKGFVSKAEADRIQKASQSSPMATGRQRKGRRKKSSVSDAVAFSPIDGQLPQEKLWRACARRWPEWVRAGDLVWEHRGFVPGRKFELDIAFPAHRVGVEVDGWEYHGKFKMDFQRDRQKDRAAELCGWSILRFFAAEIHSDPDALVDEIAMALRIRSGDPVPEEDVRHLVTRSLSRMSSDG